jgi:hypothetical protein
MNEVANKTLLHRAYNSTQRAIAVLERALPQLQDKAFVITKLAKLDRCLTSLRNELQA